MIDTNGYQLSRAWFDFCFENPELTHADIFNFPLSHSYRIKNDVACFYMIKNIRSGKCYIGQSKSFYSRMRSHIYNSRNNKGLLVDLCMNENEDDYRFIILITFDDLGINFFTRKRISLVEQLLIECYNSYKPNGYNEFICFK